MGEALERGRVGVVSHSWYLLTADFHITELEVDCSAKTPVKDGGSLEVWELDRYRRQRIRNIQRISSITSIAQKEWQRKKIYKI